jgi:glycosyltransferase involved in cell wall biosynthesis
VDGTRPALLDQLGFGNCVLVRDSPANVEVVAQHGATFDRRNPEPGLAAALQDLVDRPAAVEALRRLAPSRIEQYYNWEWITDFYEDLFGRLCGGKPPAQFEEYLARTGHLFPGAEGARR